MKPITIATRKSALALWQANHVKALLERFHPTLKVDLLLQETKGDLIQDRPLATIGGKGLFIKELEQRILEGVADLAVHSLKDVPMVLPEGFELAAILERECPLDAIITHENTPFDDLSSDAIIGTCSLRRQSQLGAHFPGWRMLDLRGNVDTRLRKLRDGQFDAIVLAHAGLKRMGWEDQVNHLLEPAMCCPAAGQGAVAVESRVGDSYVKQLLAPLHHEVTAKCVNAERHMSRLLGGSCQVPLGAYAQMKGSELYLRGVVGLPDGSRIVSTEQSGGDAIELGGRAAEELVAQGADELLEVMGVVRPGLT